MFCQSLGMEIPTEERTINSKTVTVQLLPNINEDDLNGTPVTAVVGRGTPYTNKQGKEVNPWQVKFVKAWDEGKTRDFTEEIPF